MYWFEWKVVSGRKQGCGTGIGGADFV